jgi:hypothetical protein
VDVDKVTWKEAYSDAARKVDDLTRANFLLRQENEALKSKCHAAQSMLDDTREAFRLAGEIKKFMLNINEDMERLWSL